MTNLIEVAACNYESIDPLSLDRNNYQQSNRYLWLSTFVVGDDAYVSIEGKAFKTKTKTVEDIEKGESTGDVYLTCDFGNHTDFSYYVNTNEGKFMTERESTEPPSWSRHYEEPDMMYE